MVPNLYRYFNCIDRRSNKRRCYEIIDDSQNQVLITRWGRVGAKLSRKKYYPYKNIGELNQIINTITLRRIKRGYTLIKETFSYGALQSSLLTGQTAANGIQLSLF